MAATAIEINNYLASIYYAQSVYMDKLVRYEQLGHKDVFNYRVKATILECFVYLMVEYLTQSPYDSNNFFTTDEAEEIMYKINKICDTNFYLDI